MLLVKLNEIKENLQIIKEHTKCDIIMVVKSNAYGLGSKNLIPFYNKVGIKYFFVNHYYEYLQNELEFKDSKVIVMDSMKLTKHDNIIYTINNLEDAVSFRNINKNIKVHIQIDLKMNRLGIKSINEFNEVLTVLKNNKMIEIEGIYGHFPVSIDNMMEYNNLCEYFLTFSERYNFKLIHTAATPSLHKRIIGNYVRIGIGAYGYGNPNLPLKNGLCAYEKPVNILSLLKGERVGYENDHNTLITPQQVAVIPVGYYECNQLTKIRFGQSIYHKIGEFCMNHSHFIVDDKINNLTYLSILEKNDTIDMDKINCYHYLISLSNYRKIYIMRYRNDISRIIKKRNNKSNVSRTRIFSYQNINPRIIWL